MPLTTGNTVAVIALEAAIFQKRLEELEVLGEELNFVILRDYLRSLESSQILHRMDEGQLLGFCTKLQEMLLRALGDKGALHIDLENASSISANFFRLFPVITDVAK